MVLNTAQLSNYLTKFVKGKTFGILAVLASCQLVSWGLLQCMSGKFRSHPNIFLDGTWSWKTTHTISLLENSHGSYVNQLNGHVNRIRPGQHVGKAPELSTDISFYTSSHYDSRVSRGT